MELNVCVSVRDGDETWIQTIRFPAGSLSKLSAEQMYDLVAKSAVLALDAINRELEHNPPKKKKQNG